MLHINCVFVKSQWCTVMLHERKTVLTQEVKYFGSVGTLVAQCSLAIQLQLFCN